MGDCRAHDPTRQARRYGRRCPKSCHRRARWAYFWSWDGTLERIDRALDATVREQAGREASLTTAIIDSQSGKRASSTRFYTLAWFRLQEPFRQERRPRLPPDDPVDREVLVLLIVLDRLFGGRAKIAVLDQDGKAAPLVQHQLKVLHRRRTGLRLYPLPQHRQAEGHLSVRHLPFLLLG